MYMTSAPTTPRMAVDESVISDCAVNELITLSSSLATPPANTRASACSA